MWLLIDGEGTLRPASFLLDLSHWDRSAFSFPLPSTPVQYLSPHVFPFALTDVCASSATRLMPILQAELLYPSLGDP